MADAFEMAWNLVKDSDHPLDFPDDPGDHPPRTSNYSDTITGRMALPESIRNMPGGDALVGPKLEEVLRHTEYAPDMNVYEEALFGEDGEGDADLYEEMFQAYLESQREKEMKEGIDDPRDKGYPEMPMVKPIPFRDELDARSMKNRPPEEEEEVLF
mgnify:CR=1 FL=1